MTGVTYRNPALLAKTATTLDVISGGRAILGLGAAWNEVEHAGYGFEFPPIRERMDRLDEALTIIRAMFTEERPSFEGRYYRIERGAQRAAAGPAGRPDDPGRRRRRAADAADRGEARGHDATGSRSASRCSGTRRRCSNGYCEEIGRDPSTIERTMGAPVIVAATEAEEGALLERIPRSGDRTSTSGRPSRRPTRCSPTSTPASPGSRSTTRSTGRPRRSPGSVSCCGSSAARHRPSPEPVAAIEGRFPLGAAITLDQLDADPYAGAGATCASTSPSRGCRSSTAGWSRAGTCASR